MPEAFGAALAVPGLPWLILLSFTVGVVYGFAGFGSALIFMPLATTLIPPALAVGAFSLSSLGSAATVLPGAWRQANRRASLTMLAAALAFTPVGLEVLARGDPAVLRWAVAGVVFATLAALISGWRYRAEPGPATWVAVGTGVGVVGGATGLNGPVLVLFQLAGPDGIAATRANTIVVLTLSSLSYLPLMALRGNLPEGALGLGLMMVPAYALGGLAGRRLFDPERTRLYRGVAYGLIGVAGIMGLPLWH